MPEEVRAVTRAFDLLEALSARGGEAGVGDLAAALDMPAASVHRLLHTLTLKGYVLRLPSRRYSLGPGLIGLGEATARRISSWAMPALTRLGEASRETANLAVLDGDLVSYIAQVPSPHQMRMFTEVGRRVLPHAAGVGKALLAQLPDEHVRELVGRTGLPVYTPTTLHTIDALVAELHAIRERGYAIDDGEQEVGVRCYAMPVVGHTLPMAVSISGPAARVTVDSAPQMLRALRDAAETIRSAMPARAV